jgi:2,4-dienoyl-CoA reductase-like NADH-dependent reductase (Old Yellow Enzyme family)
VAEVRAGHRERELDADDLYIGLQLTHSGRFARPEGPLAPRIAYHHPPLEEKYAVDGSITALTDGELEAIGANYVLAAEAAERAGFDFVDVKCCHGYLLHELLGAHRREGDYGGSFDNRTRLFRRIVSGIRSRCTKLDVGVRVSLVDVFPHSANPETRVGEAADWQRHVPYDLGFGVDPDDPRRFDFRDGLRFLGLVESLGIRLVNLTLGSPYYCPHLQRPAAYPPSDGYLPPEDPLLGVMAHLDCARRAKAAFPGLVIVGTGYSYLQEYLPHVAQYEVGQGHVDVVGLGRMSLVYPDLAQDVLDVKTLEKRRICRTFSDCTTAPRNGMVSGCYPLDLHYKNSPEAKRLKLIKKEQR